MSIREIARRTGLARKTVKKYLRSDESDPKYLRRFSSSKLDPYAEKLANWLVIEATKSRKQRRTLRQIHTRRGSRTYPHREHLLLTKSVGQDLMEKSGQTAAEFNSYHRSSHLNDCEGQMARQKTSSEREIQAATMQALATFFDREQVVYRHLDPANSSQGERLNQFYGDLVSVIGGGHFLMIEFKALNHHNLELMAWDDYQYEVALSAEDAGIPIIYCYDFVKPLAYYENPQNWKSWPTETLMGVKASVPSDLSSKTPLIDDHVSLLEWMNTERKKPPSMIVEEFVKAVGYVTPTMLRNEIVFVLFSKEIALRFDGDAIPDFLDWLNVQNLKSGPNYKVIESLQHGLFPPPDPGVSTKPRKNPKV